MAKPTGRTLPRAIDSTRILQGLRGPAGTRIRLATPEDAAAIEHLHGRRDAHELADSLEHGRTSSAVLTSLRTRRTLRSLVQTRALMDDQIDFSAASVLLVAENQASEIVGTLFAGPPQKVIERAAETDITLAVLIAAEVARISELLVDPTARGGGVGSELLRRVVQLYQQLDYRTIYGQFDALSTLDTYYSRRGFIVLPEDTGLLVTPAASHQLQLQAYPGEQLFYRGRGLPINLN